MKIVYPNSKKIQTSMQIGVWENKVPVFDVKDMYGLNQLVGYVKLINAETGTVLFRGQSKLYSHLISKIRRSDKKFNERKNALNKTVNNILKDEPLKKFFQFKVPSISGWEIYEKNLIEAVLQHYGAETFSMDFVDNPWIALWFGCYDFDENIKKYNKRKCNNQNDGSDNIKNFISPQRLPDRPKKKEILIPPTKKQEISKINDKDKKRSIEASLREIYFRQSLKQWEKECQNIKFENKNLDCSQVDHMFLLLYVAETTSPNLRGFYIGKQTYVLDLRKMLPSTFLRPCSQQGWIIKPKKIRKT